eukprot:TRINITY_DN6632_c0_g1_i1.p1 TRINITY_DN6632_c0_g1~~TRINITY_DN6632_c0_g1_i1.p1  ORF type:complete len:170 (-),score=5.28 TRINITY_DN6632_c0_g1_i1:92-601(-)
MLRLVRASRSLKPLFSSVRRSFSEMGGAGLGGHCDPISETEKAKVNAQRFHPHLVAPVTEPPNRWRISRMARMLAHIATMEQLAYRFGYYYMEVSTSLARDLDRAFDRMVNGSVAGTYWLARFLHMIHLSATPSTQVQLYMLYFICMAGSLAAGIMLLDYTEQSPAEFA